MSVKYKSSTTLIFLDPSVRTILIHDIIRNPIRAIQGAGFKADTLMGVRHLFGKSCFVTDPFQGYPSA